MADTSHDTNTVLLVTALKNAHAMEKEAEGILARQVDRVKSYPMVHERLQVHLGETRTQARRLEEVLSEVGESPSAFKDVVTSIVGNMAAIGHAPFGDEIIKDTLANVAFENFEMAAYKSTFVIAEAMGKPQVVRALQPSLDEELAMIAWLNDNLAEVTRTYMRLRASPGTDASH